MHAKFQGCGEGSAPGRARFRGLSPSPAPAPRTAQGCGIPGEAGWILPGKEGSGHPSHPRPGTAAPPPEPVGVAAAVNTHRVQRWAGPLGSRTAAPPRCRDGVSARHTPSGPPPGPRLGTPRRRWRPRLHGEEKRLRSNWTGGGDGGGGPGSELSRARASLSAPHSPQPRSRSGLGCKELPHWRFRDERWLAQIERAFPWPSWAPPLRASERSLACRPGAQARVSVSHGLTDRQGGGPPTAVQSWGKQDPGSTGRLCTNTFRFSTVTPRRRSSSQFTDAKTETKHKLHQCLAIGETWSSKIFPLSPNGFPRTPPPSAF